MGAKILIVEDERITAEDIKYVLKSVGYEVPAICSSGEDAIDKAEEFHPDLVLMDITLAGEMDGIEAAEHIKERYDIPIIYLTAYSDANTLKRIKITDPSGYVFKEPFGFIRKPFNEDELHTNIDLTLYRDNMEKKLIENQNWLSAILKSVSDAVIITDCNRKIKLMNQKAEEITSRIKNEKIEEGLNEIFSGLNQDISELNIDNSHFSNIPINSQDGKKIWLEGNIIQIKKKNGKINDFILIFKAVD